MTSIKHRYIATAENLPESCIAAALAWAQAWGDWTSAGRSGDEQAQLDNDTRKPDLFPLSALIRNDEEEAVWHAASFAQISLRCSGMIAARENCLSAESTISALRECLTPISCEAQIIAQTAVLEYRRLATAEHHREETEAPAGPFERFFSHLTPIAECANVDQRRAHLLAAYQLGFTLGRELAG